MKPNNLLIFIHKKKVKIVNMETGEDAKDLVELTVHANFLVKKLAELIGVTVRSLERLFQSYLHSTPKAWCRFVRVRLAGNLLASGKSPRQVCDATSFKSYSHFSREIRDYYGLPPAKLCQQLGGDYA